ncbi:hypothetical protein F4820DRAFT_25730 [Hypoxylon rubiginosum]|uniref:Uncharacterized protein n=1 Tax=Hypoxylon rubiginosum TaxID=110542 RepID=A0ACB9YT10_9PEZI|nr:hypothetical protein F4820DRAFT_25730 [Hypoxylon rubiginosum]
MCQYVTHLRACYVCSHEETVLISEQSCKVARMSGVFGSCGSGVDNIASRTQHQCWKCKEGSKLIPPTPALRKTISSTV